MFLKDMIKSVLTLIEEYDPGAAKNFTNDDDVANKIKLSINRTMFEVCRVKKIPKYIEMNVDAGDVITFETLSAKCGYEIYQVNRITGVSYNARANGTVFKITDSGIAEIDVYIYPDAITDKTNDSYEFELSADVLEVMPYGVAADILSTDVSSNYKEFKQLFETKLSRLDTRYQMPSVRIGGGYVI